MRAVAKWRGFGVSRLPFQPNHETARPRYRETASAFRRGRFAAPACQNHRQRVKLAPQGIERQVQSLEREGSKEGTVAGLSKDHVRAADEILVTKEGNAFPTGDLGTVSEAEVLCLERFHAKFIEDRCRDDAVNRAGVDQKLDGPGIVR